MKILITTKGDEWDSLVDSRFGRASYYILYDEDSDSFEAYSNEENQNATHGAGIQAGQKVAELGAGVVITGHVGPKASATLKNSQVKVYSFSNDNLTVREAYQQFKEDSLREL